MSARGTDWAVQFQLPSTAVFTGPNNTIWGANGTDNANFYLTRVNSRISLPLTYVGTYGTQHVVQGSACTASSYCCQSNGIQRTFTLAPTSGSPSYDIYSLAFSPQVAWDFTVNLTIGNNVTILPLS